MKRGDGGLPLSQCGGGRLHLPSTIPSPLTLHPSPLTPHPSPLAPRSSPSPGRQEAPGDSADAATHKGRIGQIWLLAPLAIRTFGREQVRLFFSECGAPIRAEAQALVEQVEQVERHESKSLKDLGEQLARMSLDTGTFSDVARRLAEMMWGLSGAAFMCSGFDLGKTWAMIGPKLPQWPLGYGSCRLLDADAAGGAESRALVVSEPQS